MTDEASDAILTFDEVAVYLKAVKKTVYPLAQQRPTSWTAHGGFVTQSWIVSDQ